MTAPREDEKFVGQLFEMCRRVGYDNFTFVNVGALDGWEAHRVAVEFPDAQVVAIEAHPVLAAQYCREFPDIEYHSALIGRETGQADFYSGAQPGLSSLHNRGGQVYRLEAVRLDEWCRRHDIRRVDILFIDTEGNDYEVLVGAGALLDSVTAVIAEAQTTRIYAAGRLKEDIDDLLDAHGLRPHSLDEYGYSAGVQGNYFWTRRA